MCRKDLLGVWFDVVLPTTCDWAGSQSADCFASGSQLGALHSSNTQNSLAVTNFSVLFWRVTNYLFECGNSGMEWIAWKELLCLHPKQSSWFKEEEEKKKKHCIWKHFSMCKSFVKLSIFVYGGCVCLRAVFVCLTFKFGDELKHLQKYHRLLKHLLEINKNLNPGFSSVLLVLSFDFNEGTFCASTLIALTSKQCNSGFFKCHIKAYILACWLCQCSYLFRAQLGFIMTTKQTYRK